MGRAPLEHRIMVMAITAADDCTQNVRIPPSTRNTSVVRNELGSNEAKKSSTAWFSPRCISWPVLRRMANAKIRKAIPNRKSPI